MGEDIFQHIRNLHPEITVAKSGPSQWTTLEGGGSGVRNKVCAARSIRGVVVVCAEAHISRKRHKEPVKSVTPSGMDVGLNLQQ